MYHTLKVIVYTFFKLFERSIILKTHFLPHASVKYFVSVSILNSIQIEILYARCHLTCIYD